MNVDDDSDILFIQQQQQQPSIFPSSGMMPATKKLDEQKFKDDLIEKATMRLRRRLLEEQLSEVMQSVIQTQSQLEFLRVDASATIDAVTNIQDDVVQCGRLEALERRLEAHRKQLDQLTKTSSPSPSSSTEPHRGLTDMDDDNDSCNTSVKGCSNTKKSHAFSMSRLSSLSLMSSLFSRASSPSTRATSSAAASSCSYDDDDHEYDDVDDDCTSVASSIMSNTPEEHQRRHRRRRRVKHHRQAQRMRTDDVTELQWSQKAPTLFPLPEQPATTTTTTAAAATRMHYDDMSNNNNNTMYLVGREDACSDISTNSEDNNSDVLSDIGSMSTASTLSHPRALYDLLDSKQLDRCHTHGSLYPPFSPQQQDVRARHPLSPLTDNFFLEKSVYSTMSNINNNNNDYYELDRNVLDDALSFLDSMSVDDGGFGDDIDFLLRHPDLCCRPLDEIRTTMVEFRNKHYYELDQQNGVTIPTALYHYGARWMSSMGYSACVRSVRWCKFLSILFAATMISVLKGPDDMLDAY
ncbi:hypothetical protein BDB00DRAFT_874624 [Zychaea mexicana]|uniref:uncharacterized protein n=1 Tax=Zychaea mexicana TaxID=64656 RepID=UPI0022FE3C86|nr:uncharacterized protein BDB00DRAFT_874624 [Zychaea mexicana]KAI9491229.1 hypothetical protein BDB00DRAFT_874624 [Zychaea mexicana]